MSRRLHYICTPYSNDIPDNLRRGAEYCNKLLDIGLLIYSPIHHSHLLDMHQERDSDFWYRFDLKMLERCDVLILCPNWTRSRGCKLEIERANELNMPILKYEEIIKVG